MEQGDKLLARLLEIMGSSEFLVLLNGVPRKYNNSYVYAKIKRDPKKDATVEFYTKFSSGGKKFIDTHRNLNDTIISDALNNTLFGFNFSDWAEGKGLIGNVSINNSLRLLFIETPMYTIFKKNIPNRDNLNIKFAPTSRGKELTTLELSYMLDQFRVNSFLALIELERSGITRRIALKTPRFYKNPEAYFLSSVREPNLFNPLFDDNMIYSTIKDREIIKEIQDKSAYYEHTKTYVTYLSHYQASKLFGLNVLVPFDYRIFTSLIIGLVMAPDSIPEFLPHKDKRIWRLSVATDEDFDLTISDEEYRESSEYKRSFYVRSTTLNSFLLHNFDFFRSRGFSDANRLIDVMSDIVLL